MGSSVSNVGIVNNVSIINNVTVVSNYLKKKMSMDREDEVCKR